MNNKQLLAAFIGVVALCIVYYIKSVMLAAKLKQEHPEIFAANPPNAIVGGLWGTITLLIVLIATIVVVVMLRGKG